MWTQAADRRVELGALSIRLIKQVKRKCSVDDLESASRLTDIEGGELK